MNDRPQHAGTLTAQIDRLVTGELPEHDRRSLLAWFDEEPTRWRACALAFLEAQAWEQATEEFGDQRSEVGSEGSGFGVQGTKGPKSEVGDRRSAKETHHSPLTTHSSSRHWLAIAGAALLAFALGLASARHWPVLSPTQDHLAVPVDVQPGDEEQGPPAEPLLATVSVPTNLDPRLTAQLTLPIAAADEFPASEPISEYVRKQWERRGFELEEETRYLPAKLPDGRTVMVPVTKVHVRLKRTPVS
jgi:hypothetical protein